MASYDPNSTENEGRIRLRDPKDFAEDSFYSTKSWRGKSAPGVRFIVGRLRQTVKEVEQAIRFRKDEWPDADKAWAWVRNNGFERVSTGTF